MGSNFAYGGRLHTGDAITATVIARAKHADGLHIDFECRATNAEGVVLVDGVATVTAPAQRIAYNDIATPEVLLRRNDGLARLLKRCEALPPILCAVVHPCDRDSLVGAVEAARLGLIVPVLVGPEARSWRTLREPPASTSRDCASSPRRTATGLPSRAVAMGGRAPVKWKR